MATKVLLVDDVHSLGRKGDVVSVRPGYARNFLFPKGFAVTADARALRIQERLKQERELKAVEDRKEAESVAKLIDGKALTIFVKVDQEGHMYGSVSVLDIIRLIEDSLRVTLDKRFVSLKHPIKELGVFTIPVKLKEGIECSCTLKIVNEIEEAAQES